MHNKAIKLRWIIGGVIGIPAVLIVETFLAGVFAPGSFPVHRLPLLAALDRSYAPGVAGLLVLSVMPTLLYIAALVFDRSKRLFPIEFTVLALNLTLLLVFWAGGVSPGGYAYVSLLLAVQALGFLTFSLLIFMGAKRNTENLKCAAHMVFFLALTAVFPLLFFHRIEYLGIG